MLRYLLLITFRTSAICVPVRKRSMMDFGVKSVFHLCCVFCLRTTFVGHHMGTTFFCHHRTTSPFVRPEDIQ